MLDFAKSVVEAQKEITKTFVLTENLEELLYICPKEADEMREKARKDDAFANELLKTIKEKQCMGFCQEMSRLFSQLADPVSFHKLCEEYARDHGITTQRMKETVITRILTETIQLDELDADMLFSV